MRGACSVQLSMNKSICANRLNCLYGLIIRLSASASVRALGKVKYDRRCDCVQIIDHFMQLMDICTMSDGGSVVAVAAAAEKI